MEQLDLSLYSEKRPGIEKVRYTHDAMIDMIVANPWISQNEIAMQFGYTPPWVSMIFASDAFQARLAARKEDVIDPAVRATVEERFKALVLQSIEILQEKLAVNRDPELALNVMNGAAKAVGYGARIAAPVVQNNFVVHVPAKSASSAEWELEHAVPRAQRVVPHDERVVALEE